MNRFSRSPTSSLPSQITSWQKTLQTSKPDTNTFFKNSLPGMPDVLSLVPTLPSLPTLPELPSLTSPTPNMAEAVAQPPQNDGLFNGIIGDPAVLYRAYLDRPEDFDEEQSNLILQLMSNQKKLDQLTDQERKVLDRATVNFAQHSPRSNVKPSPSPKSSFSPTPTTDPGRSSFSWQKDEMRLPPLKDPIDIPTIPSKWWDQGPGGALR